MVSGDKEKYDYLFKYMVVGDVLGKSNLLLRYERGKFDPSYITIGMELFEKNIKIRNKTYRLQIWDTSGCEMFKSINRSYYKNSACSLIVYDITNRISFINVSNLFEDFKNISPKTILMVLVGNKSDLPENREVDTKEGQKLADK